MCEIVLYIKISWGRRGVGGTYKVTVIIIRQLFFNVFPCRVYIRTTFLYSLSCTWKKFFFYFYDRTILPVKIYVYQIRTMFEAVFRIRIQKSTKITRWRISYFFLMLNFCLTDINNYLIYNKKNFFWRNINFWKKLLVFSLF